MKYAIELLRKTDANRVAVEIMGRYSGRRTYSGRPDYPAMREAWGIWLDSLCKGGEISMELYENAPGISEFMKFQRRHL